MHDLQRILSQTNWEVKELQYCEGMAPCLAVYVPANTTGPLIADIAKWAVTLFIELPEPVFVALTRWQERHVAMGKCIIVYFPGVPYTHPAAPNV